MNLVTQGYGEAQPRVPNLDKDGHPVPDNQRRNRRVEITTTSTADASPTAGPRAAASPTS